MCVFCVNLVDRPRQGGVVIFGAIFLRLKLAKLPSRVIRYRDLHVKGHRVLRISNMLNGCLL